MNTRRTRNASAALALLTCGAWVGTTGATPPVQGASSDSRQDVQVVSRQPDLKAKPHLDLSGRKRVGKASIYARKLAGRKMADGTILHPHSDSAASKTLPLGTTAKVTNLETGQSAVVTIRDRGPFVKGRIVDLSPSTAQKIGIDPEDGVAKVEVAPIAVPLPDGTVKPGAADQESKQDRETPDVRPK